MEEQWAFVVDYNLDRRCPHSKCQSEWNQRPIDDHVVRPIENERWPLQVESRLSQIRWIDGTSSISLTTFGKWAAMGEWNFASIYCRLPRVSCLRIWIVFSLMLSTGTSFMQLLWMATFSRREAHSSWRCTGLPQPCVNDCERMRRRKITSKCVMLIVVLSSRTSLIGFEGSSCLFSSGEKERWMFYLCVSFCFSIGSYRHGKTRKRVWFFSPNLISLVDGENNDDSIDQHRKCSATFEDRVGGRRYCVIWIVARQYLLLLRSVAVQSNLRSSINIEDKKIGQRQSLTVTGFAQCFTN